MRKRIQVEEVEKELKSFDLLEKYWNDKLKGEGLSNDLLRVYCAKIAEIQIERKEFISAFVADDNKSFRNRETRKAHINCFTNRMRTRWKSKFAGRVLFAGIIKVKDDSDGIEVNGNEFLLTTGRAGELLDKLIERRLNVRFKNNRSIRFTRSDRNSFKHMRFTNSNLNAEYFFTKIIRLVKDIHGKIVAAELNPELFEK